MFTVAIGNEKGGAGKTTTTANLAAVAGAAGLRVLVVDADPQGQLSDYCFGVDPRPGLSLGELLDASIANRPSLDAVRLRHVVPGVDLLPADRAPLERAEAEMGRDPLNGLGALRVLLAQVQDEYDLALIDTPPRLLGLTTGALVAADAAVVVMSPTTLHFAGATAFIEKVRQVGASPLNPNLQLLGVLFNAVDKTAEETSVIAAMVEAEGWPIFAARVPQSRLASKANLSQTPVVLAYPKNPVTEGFRAAADELMEQLAAMPDVLAGEAR